jgi:hypothetical protein
MTDQWSAEPALTDNGKQPVLDLIPFAGTGLIEAWLDTVGQHRIGPGKQASLKKECLFQAGFRGSGHSLPLVTCSQPPL